MNHQNVIDMKSIRKSIFFIAGCVLLMVACEQMNDRHRKYFEDGEIIYIGKVDSMRVLPGNERVVFRYWISDPRAKSLTATWSNGKEYLQVDVPPRAPTDSFDLQIGKNEKELREGIYTFHWVVSDNKGNRSVVHEQIANVYGDRYRSLLYDWFILSAIAADNTVTITWAESISEQEAGVTIKYTTGDGVAKTVHYSKSALKDATVLENVNLTIKPQYQTKFLPAPLAVDTFYTDFVDIPIQ